MEALSGLLVLVLTLLLVVLVIAGVWKTFEKAGESGWKALIPFYNIYVMFRISGHSGWWLAVLFLPLIVLVIGASVVEVTAPFSPESGAPDGLGIFMNFFAVTVQISVLTSAVMMYDIARSFGKGLAFTIGLGALPFVFWPLLGFGKTEYRGPVAHPKMIEKGAGAHMKSSKSDEEKVQSDSNEADSQSEQEE